METIKTYLDNMFINLPKTDEIINLKNDMLVNMEDKYNELKEEGKTENEAIGIVISEFGNIDELIKEMNININSTTEDENSKTLSIDDVKNYLEAKKNSGKKIAIGVFLCVIAPAISLLLSELLNYIIDDLTISENLSSIPLFILIIIAVSLFISTGISVAKYDKLTKSPFKLEPQTKEYIEQEYEKSRSSFTSSVIIGVALCILSVVPSIIVSTFSDNETYENLGACLLFLFVAIGVFNFIKVGSIDTSFQELLKFGYFSSTQKIENNKFLGTIAGIVWPLITALYLLLSFLSEKWGITWIIWPISGILFGTFCAIYHAIKPEKKEVI